MYFLRGFNGWWEMTLSVAALKLSFHQNNLSCDAFIFSMASDIYFQPTGSSLRSTLRQWLTISKQLLQSKIFFFYLCNAFIFYLNFEFSHEKTDVWHGYKTDHNSPKLEYWNCLLWYIFSTSILNEIIF